MGDWRCGEWMEGGRKGGHGSQVGREEWWGVSDGGAGGMEGKRLS